MSLASKYDAFYASEKAANAFSDVVVRGWPRNRVEAVLAHAPQGGAVLDVGCGDGYLLFQLRSRYQKLIGLEYSASRLADAERHLADLPFQGVLGSAERMDALPDASLDCIVSADTIEHIPDVYAAASELFRVLRPGGSLVINTPNIASLKRRITLLLGRFPGTSQPNEGLGSDLLFDGGHLHYFTFRSLRLLLERAGFRIDREVGYGRLGRAHQLYPAMLSGGVQLVASKPT